MRNKYLTGISEIDHLTGGGVAPSDLNVVATSDDRVGNMVLGHFIHEGLKKGETTLLISFEKKQSFFDNFKLSGIDFEPYYEKKQFLFYNFISNIRHKVGFLQDYRALFNEIYRLAENQVPTRVAIDQVDALLNLSNTQLIHLTCEKLASSCRSRTARGITTLAQYVKFNDKTHQSLGVALQKSAAGYMELLNKKNDKDESLELHVKKMPWFNFQAQPITINSKRVSELFGNVELIKTHVAA